MTLCQRLLAAVTATLCLASLPAAATTHSTDFTDLWYNANEEGWGLNVIQQGNTLFATMFVYGNDQSARWFVASDMKPAGAGAGQNGFAGKLYQTTGPFFGAPAFNETQVGVTEVGDMTLLFTSASTATLTYTVSGTGVVKQLTRQTFVTNSPAGVFQGGIDAITSACAVSSQNGGAATFLGFINATINAQGAVQMQMNYLLNTQQAICNFTGTYSQQGRLGAITGGQWSCNFNGQQLNLGTYSVTNLDIQVTGMTGVFNGVDQHCSYSGRFGGLRTSGN